MKNRPEKPIGILTEHDFMVRAVCKHALANDKEFERFSGGCSELAEARTLDYHFATSHEPHDPAGVFHRLRWGGQFVFASRHAREVVSLAEEFTEMGFVIERGPDRVHRWFLGVPLIRVGPRVHYFIARKVHLLPPGDYSARFTYDVFLERFGGKYIVVKRLPSVESVIERLRMREKHNGDSSLELRARQLVEDVLPVFLTREAGFLQLLQKDMPEEMRSRVPTALAAAKNDRGQITRLHLNWLRKTDRTMSQLEFAIQSAQLLHALHMAARIVHFDLRLDNFVITDEGVGFVDFGSASRAGEHTSTTPLMKKLFEQLVRTSQVQKLMRHMTQSGRLTSRYLIRAVNKVDRAVDLFMLCVQMERPDTNPYTRELVVYDPNDPAAKRISELRQEVLCPAEPLRPTHSSVQDVLRSLQEIRQRTGA